MLPPEVGSGSVSRIHLPDHDPWYLPLREAFQDSRWGSSRQAFQRTRFGSSNAQAAEKVDPSRSGEPRDEVGAPPSLGLIRVG